MTVEQAGGAYSEPGAGSEKLTLDVGRFNLKILSCLCGFSTPE